MLRPIKKISSFVSFIKNTVSNLIGNKNLSTKKRILKYKSIYHLTIVL